MTDPIADLLTRIRNGLAVKADVVSIPYSREKKAIVEVLKKEGYIADWTSEMEGARGVLRVSLKYGPDGEQVIRELRRVSKPGRRVYSSVRDLPEPLNGLGIAIVSTSRGVVSQGEARKLQVGGEVLCEVW